MEHHLGDLKMEGARFAVEFQTQPAADGCYVTRDGAAQRLAFDQTGFDRVEFLISANPGEPPKPLVKVASGGETARLMPVSYTHLDVYKRQLSASPKRLRRPRRPRK